MITTLSSITSMKSKSYALPFYGIDLMVLDPKTRKEIKENDIKGILVIKQSS